MANKLNETETQETIRAVAPVISALGQYFDPAFKQLSVALCIEGSLVMIPQSMVENGFTWVALDSNGDIYAYKREPRFEACSCGIGRNAAWVTAPNFDIDPARFVRTIGPVSTETARQSLFYIGGAN